MDASGSHSANKAYYDAFSQRYEKHRGRNDPGGYHELLDGLEADFVERFGRGKRVLEVGCGTGLVLTRLAEFASEAKGIDLSEGMLEKARARGLSVTQGSATELPFDDNEFDVTCSFKVLAHIPDISLALSEMARVTRPGGVVLAEFYNPNSLRAWLKRLGPAGRVAANAHEDQVYTAFHSPAVARRMTPPGCEFLTGRGVRIVTPAALVMRLPIVKRLFWRSEWLLADTALQRYAGFWIGAFRKLEP